MASFEAPNDIHVEAGFGRDLVLLGDRRRPATSEAIRCIHPLQQANAKTLLTLLRDHWQIENGLHYVRDVTLGEDACRVRSGTAPQVLAALRNAVVHLLTEVKAESRPEAIEILQLHPEQARTLIGIPQCE